MQIAAMVFLSILVVEAIILIPSYQNYKNDLLARLADIGQTAVITGFQTHAQTILGSSVSVSPLVTGEKITRITKFKGGTLIYTGWRDDWLFRGSARTYDQQLQKFGHQNQA